MRIAMYTYLFGLWATLKTLHLNKLASSKLQLDWMLVFFFFVFLLILLFSEMSAYQIFDVIYIYVQMY